MKNIVSLTGMFVLGKLILLKSYLNKLSYPYRYYYDLVLFKKIISKREFISELMKRDKKNEKYKNN